MLKQLLEQKLKEKKSSSLREKQAKLSESFNLPPSVDPDVEYAVSFMQPEDAEREQCRAYLRSLKARDPQAFFSLISFE